MLKMLFSIFGFKDGKNQTGKNAIVVFINLYKVFLFSLSSKFGGLVIICMVIFFIFILFSQLEFGYSSRTAGGKSLRKHKASKRTKLRQVLPLLIAILIGVSLSKQTIIVDSYFTGVDYTKVTSL